MLLQYQMMPSLLKLVLLPRNNLMHCRNCLDIFLFLLKQFQQHPISTLVCLHTKGLSYPPWIVDYGTSDYMTRDASISQHYKLNHGVSIIRIADGSLSKVVGIGTIQLTKDLIPSHVLHVPNLDCNLISISKLTCDLNCVTKFYPNLCEFQAMDLGKVIGNADC